MFDEKFLALLLLFFPGMIGVLLINYVLESYRKLEINLFFLYSFVLGVISYLPFSFFCEDSNIFKLNVSPRVIICATILALIISAIVIFIVNSEFLHLCIRKMKLSKTMGRKFILKNIVSSKDSKMNYLLNHWVLIRYQNKEQCFQGLIGAIDILEDNYVEILLKDVSAFYDNKDNPSYTVEATYLCEKLENIIIEFQKNI
ncbi:hypothetical protein HUW83_06490 [Fusobacterium animalis]|uniref:hypothetical protein n=1 Tax=Fusobacterium animalis TaxID=76859 RepID=UPI0030D5C0D3